MINEQSTIAVIGGSDLAMLLRLAGLGSYHILDDKETLESDVRSTLKSLIADEKISIIAIQADYAKYAKDIIDAVAEDKRLTPVIIEVPSKDGTGTKDAAGYYRAFVRKFVGFDIEI